MEFYDVVFSWEFLATQVGLAAAVWVVAQAFKMLVPLCTDQAVRVVAFVTGCSIALGVFVALTPFVLSGEWVLGILSALLNGAVVALAVMKGVEIGKHGINGHVLK